MYYILIRPVGACLHDFSALTIREHTTCNYSRVIQLVSWSTPVLVLCWRSEQTQRGSRSPVYLPVTTLGIIGILGIHTSPPPPCTEHWKLLNKTSTHGTLIKCTPLSRGKYVTTNHLNKGLDAGGLVTSSLPTPAIPREIRDQSNNQCKKHGGGTRVCRQRRWRLGSVRSVF